MKLPNFTAEAALYDTAGRYQGVGNNAPADNAVYPMQFGMPGIPDIPNPDGPSGIPGIPGLPGGIPHRPRCFRFCRFTCYGRPPFQLCIRRCRIICI